jgi:hypothetical protein
VDERDKDLTGLFVRDLDEIKLPPRGAWRRAPGRENIAMRGSRHLLTAAVVVAGLAIALIVGFQLRDRSATVVNPSASPRPELTNVPIIVRPSPTANPTVTPTPSSSATLLRDRYGFIVSAGGGFTATVYRIQTETGTRIGEFSGFAPAVSLDGRQVAYWEASGPGTALRLIDPTKPTEARTLLTLPSTERGGGSILWSPDGTALVIAVYSADSFEGIDAGPKVASLRTLRIDGGAPREVAQLTNGRVLLPVAWDQKANTIGAAESGAGGYMSAYDAIVLRASNEVQRTERTPVQGRVIGVQGSPDGTRVLGIWMDENTVHIWPTANFGAAFPVGKGGTVNGARWRPGSSQVWWAVNTEVGWFIPQTSSSAIMYGGSNWLTIGPFRPDGSAVVVTAIQAQTTRSSVLVDATSINTVEQIGTEPIASVVLR